MFAARFNALLIVSMLICLLASCAVSDRASENYQDIITTQDILVQDYIDSNFKQLRSEMAVGNGKHLTRLAELLAIDAGDRTRFYLLCKNNFNSLFVSPETNAEQLLINLRQEILKAAL